MAYSFFDKTSTGSSIENTNNNNNNNNNNHGIKQNQRPLDLASLQLAKKLHKPIIRKLKKIIILDLKIIFGELI